MGKTLRILDNVFRPLENLDATVFVMETNFKTAEREVGGYFLVMSSPELLNALITKASQAVSSVQ